MLFGNITNETKCQMMCKFFRLSTFIKRPLIDAKGKKNSTTRTKDAKQIVLGWKVEFEWLISDETYEKLYCKQCQG